MENEKNQNRRRDECLGNKRHPRGDQQIDLKEQEQTAGGNDAEESDGASILPRPNAHGWVAEEDERLADVGREGALLRGHDGVAESDFAGSEERV